MEVVKKVSKRKEAGYCYYGVSNNKGRFWEFANAQEELGYTLIDDARII